jgi:hypothetical protein
METQKARARVAFEVLAALAMSAAPALAEDPFSGLTSTVTSSANLWAGAIVLIGACLSGGAIIFGSQNSGKWAGRFLGGSAILALTIKGASLLTWLNSNLGIAK